MELARDVRPVPLRVAGAIGMLVAVYYVAVSLGGEVEFGPTLFWLVLMATASLLAWYADRFRGRRAAIAAAGLFFVLGILSPIVFAIVYLVAVILCVAGFVDFSRR